MRRSVLALVLVLALAAAVVVSRDRQEATADPVEGDATLGEALQLDPRQAATTVANLLGVWVDHHVDLGRKRMAAVVDRAGGIEVLEETLDGARTLQRVVAAEPGERRLAVIVLQVFESAASATVASLPVAEAASGVFVAEPDAIREALVGRSAARTRRS